MSLKSYEFITRRGEDIDESVLNFLYGVIMRLVGENQKRQEKEGQVKLNLIHEQLVKIKEMEELDRSNADSLLDSLDDI